MSAAVLGKRSRRVLDSEDLLPSASPARKRTRHCVPVIHEDAIQQDACSAREDADCFKTKQPLVKRFQKRVNQCNTATNPQKCNDVNFLDNENIPPTSPDAGELAQQKGSFELRQDSTPKQRVRVGGFCLTPRSLKKPQARLRTENIFSIGRQLFGQSSHINPVVGRDSEGSQLVHFITSATANRRGGCTYISGPPGTGKSALVQQIYSGLNEENLMTKSLINCVTLRTAEEVFQRLITDFFPDVPVGKKNNKQQLSRLFLSKSKSHSYLLVLDEIDNLVETDAEVLQTIFEWSLHKNSNLILIGIANALDLADRFLPRLKAKGLRPNLLPFLPYTATQISTIISDKLRSLMPEDTGLARDFIPLVHPAAIQLCGKKIAAQTGDLRKAFNLIRKIIEQVELETLHKISASSPVKSPLGEISNITTQPGFPSSPVNSPKQTLCISFTAETAPRATIAHAARLASSIFNHGTVSRLSGLNLQQKAVLCSLVSGEKRKAERNPFVTPSKSINKVPTVKELFNKYSILCKRDEGLLQPLKDTEFRDVISSLETLGLIHEHRGRTSSLLTPTSTPTRLGRNDYGKQIVSAVSEKEMRESLCGIGADLLRRLLEDVE